MGKIEECVKLNRSLGRGSTFVPSDKICRNNCKEVSCKYIGGRHKKKY